MRIKFAGEIARLALAYSREQDCMTMTRTIVPITETMIEPIQPSRLE